MTTPQNEQAQAAARVTAFLDFQTKYAGGITVGHALKDTPEDHISYGDLRTILAERAALLERQAALEADKRRLDFFDEANLRLNASYGTKYSWRVIMGHNVNRLLLGPLGHGVDLEDSQPHGLRSCRLAIDEAMRTAGRASWDGPLLDDLRPMHKAKKNGKPILAKFKDQIPDRPDQSALAGRYVVIRHVGLASDGFDQGWQLAGPFGQGGFPDAWFEGWTTLPGDASYPTPQSAPA